MSTSLHLCEAIAFDLDGTLVDTTSLHVAATQAASRAVFAEDAPHERVVASLGRPLPESMAIISAARGQGDALAMAYLSYYAAHADEGVQCFPGTIPLLAALQAAGYRLALLSNKLQTWGREEIARLGIAGYFISTVFMEDMPSPKPSGLALRPILEQLRLPARRVLVIGDGEGDIACAHAAGALSGAALWGVLQPAPLLAAHPHYRFDTINDVRKLLLP